MTVSRFLASPARVSEATAARIQAAIDDLGYVPNLIAGGLAATRTRIVAAIVPYIEHGVFADALQGLSERMSDAGYCVLLGSSGGSVEREEAMVRALLGHRPAGIVLQGADHSAATRRLLERARIPVVEMGTLPRNPIDMCAGYSNADAAEAITRHLIQRGRRRIGLLVADPQRNDRARHRLAGYRRALAAAGIDYAPDRVLTLGRFGIAEGREGFDRMLCQAPDLDALFCASDTWAIGALLECIRRRIAVPARLAIAGFNDQEIAAEFEPALTTVRIPRYDIGARAADMIIARIDGREHPVKLDLGFELVVRAST